MDSHDDEIVEFEKSEIKNLYELYVRGMWYIEAIIYKKVQIDRFIAAYAKVFQPLDEICTSRRRIPDIKHLMSIAREVGSIQSKKQYNVNQDILKFL